MTLIHRVKTAAQNVSKSDCRTFVSVLNDSLGQFLSRRFTARSGRIIDASQNKTPTFASVVHVQPKNNVTPANDSIPIARVGVVIDAMEILTSDGLKSAYQNIQQVKRMNRELSTKQSPIIDASAVLGIVFSKSSDASLTEISQTVAILNEAAETNDWPDLIVILSAGTINYLAQFPGSSRSGDYCPPQEGALNNYIPPIFVTMAVRPLGQASFNKMTSMIVTYLAYISNDSVPPNHKEIMNRIDNSVTISMAYQYNLGGKLLPVPRQPDHQDSSSPLPLRIENDEGELLSTIHYIPWQDGGVLLAKGKIPLEAFTMFLGKSMNGLGAVRPGEPELTVSNVLPITHFEFSQMLQRFQQNSNMEVRKWRQEWVVQKIADEGSSSPFFARIFIGIMHLRDFVFPTSESIQRKRFDECYAAVYSPLLNARTSMEAFDRLWQEHLEKVESGELARIEGNNISISDSIDEEFRKQFESFVYSTSRSLKQGMQNLSRNFGVDIGFLFQNQEKFEFGLDSLRSQDSLLSEYLNQTRNWSDPLISIRNLIEHEGWILPQITYRRSRTTVFADQPQVFGRSVTEFVGFSFDRFCCFFEDITTYMLQKHLSRNFIITEIPVVERVPHMPERFHITLATRESIPWTLNPTSPC